MTDEKSTGPVRSGGGDSTMRWVKYVFIGAAGGLVVGLAALLVVSLVYGEIIGLSPVDCAVFGCTLTMLLSQPVGAAGMVAGGVVGAVAGAILHYLSKR
jgi:hypothetical protein